MPVDRRVIECLYRKEDALFSLDSGDIVVLAQQQKIAPLASSKYQKDYDVWCKIEKD